MSAVFCAAGGSYEDSSHVDQAMLGVKAGGTWSVVEAPLPSNADTSRDSEIDAVSCPEVGTCVATGSYKDSTGNSTASSTRSPAAPGRPWTRRCPRMR